MKKTKETGGTAASTKVAEKTGGPAGKRLITFRLSAKALEVRRRVNQEGITKETACAALGISIKDYYQCALVAEQGSKALVQAMDEGLVSTGTARQLLKLDAAGLDAALSEAEAKRAKASMLAKSTRGKVKSQIVLENLETAWTYLYALHHGKYLVDKGLPVKEEDKATALRRCDAITRITSEITNWLKQGRK